MLSPYIDEISYDHQCGFLRNRSGTDKDFLHSSDAGERNVEYYETIYHPFVDFEKAYDSVRNEELYNILIEFGVPIQLIRLIKQRNWFQKIGVRI
jgi:hypothetical protein